MGKRYSAVYKSVDSPGNHISTDALCMWPAVVIPVLDRIDYSYLDRATTVNKFCEYCTLSPTKIYHPSFLFGLCSSLVLHVFVGEIWG